MYLSVSFFQLANPLFLAAGLVPGQLSTPWSVPSGPVRNLLHSGLRSVGGTFSDSDFAGLVPGQLSTPSSVPSGPVSLFSDSTGLHQLDPTTLHARLENNSGGAGTFEQGLPHLGLTAYDTARPFLYP